MALTVGMISTYGIRCGIAEYSRQLCHALLQHGCKIIQFVNRPSSRNPQDTPTEAICYELSGPERYEGFSVRGWSNEVFFDLELLNELSKRVDVWHIQWEPFLYDRSWVKEMFRSATKKPCVLTAHSALFHPEAEYDRLAFAFCHSESHLDGIPLPSYKKQRIPMGGPYQAPVITTFGLGRSDSEGISRVCRGLHYTFQPLSWQSWLPMSELIRKLKESDAIVLFYPATSAKVSSSAIRVALSTNRPVIVTDTGWFSDLEEGLIEAPVPVYRITPKESSLHLALLKLLGKTDQVNRAHSWPSVAETHILKYNTLVRGAPEISLAATR